MRELKYTEDTFISLPEDFAGHYQIPKGITKIADRAFLNCGHLKSIEIPEGVTSIGDNAFHFCSSLKEVTIPEGVTNIGEKSFYFCINLNSIRIPSTLTEAEKDFLLFARFSDDEITSILRHIENNKTKPEAKHFTHETQTSNGMTNECKTKDNEKNKCFTYIGRKDITSYSIPNEYSIIGNLSFNKCSTLKQIEIPSSVTSIGHKAFNRCSTLTQIEIPSSVTSIGYNAFNGCSTLKKIAILGNSTYIDWPLFKDCKSLEEVIIKSSRYILENGLIYNKAKTELLECISTLCDKNVVIDPKVRTINSGAFHNLENIESITLPKGLLEIEDGAFNFSDSKVNLIVQTEKIEQIEIKLDDIFKSFSNIEEGCSLTVPIGTGYTYRHHPVWKEFKTINVAPFDYGEESESEQKVDE